MGCLFIIIIVIYDNFMLFMTLSTQTIRKAVFMQDVVATKQ